jgi:Galactose oxidase, central domain
VGAGEGGVLMRAKAGPIQTGKDCPSPKVTMLILALLLAFLTYAASLSAQAPGAFTPIGNMTAPRGGHTATLLVNGKVLIAGGRSDESATAELFDPVTRTFSATGEMITPRSRHTATLLDDGRVLIAGGFFNNGNFPLTSAELYDPSTGTFSATGSMHEARAGWHTATLLYDGRVLVAGVGHIPELYDPATGTFTVTGAYAGAYAAPLVITATLLPDGKVLITGCDCPSGPGDAPLTELYDPATRTFGLAGGASGPTHWWVNENTATLLRNGNVLIAGTSDNNWLQADAELYAPSTQIFADIGSTTAPHEFSTATLLPDGEVLIAGGQVPGGFSSLTDVYDPATGKFSAAENMTIGRTSHTATLLPDGSVLIAGGYYGYVATVLNAWGYMPAPTSSAELYVPRLLTPALVVTDLRFDRSSVTAGSSYSVNVSGFNLTPQTFLDVRVTAPGSYTSDVVLNWQRGLAATHNVLVGTASGVWTITGVRAHNIETDHTGNFLPVSSTITVSP